MTQSFPLQEDSSLREFEKKVGIESSEDFEGISTLDGYSPPLLGSVENMDPNLDKNPLSMNPSFANLEKDFIFFIGWFLC